MLKLHNLHCLFVQVTLAEIRQLLVDVGVSEYGGVNCISRLGQIVGKKVSFQTLATLER